jgi:drug/metabolite transporter (DMT)-like permease
LNRFFPDVECRIQLENSCASKHPDFWIGLPFSMSNSHHPSFSAYLALGVGIVGVSFSAIFVRWAGAPGIVTGFYRMAIAAMCLAWPFYRRVRVLGGLPRVGVQTAMLGGLFFAADLALWTTGVILSGATNPTLLANTAPLWVGLGSWIFFRERFNPKFWMGLILALGGAGLILGLDTLRAAALGLGTLLGLMAAIFYGGYFLIAQRGRESLDSLTYIWLTEFSASLVLFALCTALRQPLTGYSTSTYLNFLAIGVVAQVFGWLAISYAQGYLPASLVAPTMLAQPVGTALLAALLLGERLSPWQILGGVTVLFGVYTVHRGRAEQLRNQRLT